MTFDQMMAELRQEYIQSLPEKIQNLERCWAARDLPALQDSFHKLKGTGKTYGLPEVSLVAEVMERICKTQPQALDTAAPLGLALFQKIQTVRSGGGEFDPKQDPQFSALEAF